VKISIDELQAYLEDRYGGWATEQSMFMKLVEEIGEVAEVLNKRAGRKASTENDLQEQLGIELVDMIHYIVAIAAINHIDLTTLMIEKDKKASIKYHHTKNLETFLWEKNNQEA
jgi:NTP pyrophosphatase (non-canonical NTP hydrolase)